jgi:hypothetical protein
MCVCVCVCVCVCLVLCLSLHVCVAGSLQQRLHHASMPLLGHPVQHCVSILQRRGCVASEWCSQEYARTFIHTHTLHKYPLSLSLSLSLTHTHTHTHAHARTQTHAKNMSSRQETHIQLHHSECLAGSQTSQTRLLTNRTLVA